MNFNVSNGKISSAELSLALQDQKQAFKHRKQMFETLFYLGMTGLAAFFAQLVFVWVAIFMENGKELAEIGSLITCMMALTISSTIAICVVCLKIASRGQRAEEKESKLDEIIGLASLLKGSQAA